MCPSFLTKKILFSYILLESNWFFCQESSVFILFCIRMFYISNQTTAVFYQQMIIYHSRVFFSRPRLNFIYHLTIAVSYTFQTHSSFLFPLHYCYFYFSPYKDHTSIISKQRSFFISSPDQSCFLISTLTKIVFSLIHRHWLVLFLPRQQLLVFFENFFWLVGRTNYLYGAEDFTKFLLVRKS